MPQHHLVIPDTVQVIHAGLNAGIGWRVVTHCLIPASSPVNVALADAIFNSVGPLWSTNIAPECPTTTSFNFTSVRDLRAASQPDIASTGTVRNGTAPTTDALPRQIAAVITVKTGLAGRKYRGRMYWAGFAESANGATGHMTAACKAALDAFAAGFMAAANVSGLQIGVAHRPTAFDEVTGLPISPGLGFTTPAVQFLCRDDIWDTQRRRSA